MSTTNTRERAAARARLERQMADKLESARKRKQRLIIAAAAAGILLVAGGVVWAVTSLDKGSTTATPTESEQPANNCIWTPDDPAQNPDLKDVGAPPTGLAPNKGTQTMTMNTSLGAIEIEMNTAKAPCTARSMTYLASKNFFDNTKCHRLTTEGIKVLQCGDPSGKSTGGPTYKLAEENLPDFTDDLKNYPVGTIAMANTGQPSSTGSQFFIVWGDTPLPGKYTVLGKVTKGIELVQEAAKAGAKNPETGEDANDGSPKTEVQVKTVTVTPPQ
ncbi:MAG TPA: peptidylprolyl isomerase [Candidatus Limnocylindrales bacterium]